jgi:hypothetical protein
MRARGRQWWARRTGAVLGLALALVALAHPLAGAASDVWGNVGPASPLGAGGLHGRYPLSHYALDQHFEAISASLTGGVDASGVAPMIAYFLASVLWALTAFLANLLIELFAFAFSLDLLRGSDATGGAGALAPVARAIHSIYASVFGAPWLVLAIAVSGIWAMWRALVQRRYAETAGALGLSLLYVVAALFFVAQPAKTIGTASAWTNKMSQSFLAIAAGGDPSGGARARDAGAQQLFDLLVFKPWVVLEFGGVEHCVRAGTGGGDSDPESVAVRPLAGDPGADAALARRLRAGEELGAEGKACVNNASKYAHRFLRFGPYTEERDAEYDALDNGDVSELPEVGHERAGYRLGPVDRPATDAMEEGGQYQRLLVAIVVFVGELGAFCLLGALSVGVILAQILLLLLLTLAPVALVAAAIPGRGHAFFRGWLEKLAGFLLRKAAYSLILAILLAVNGALAAATSQLGWLMSFGLQSLFFWAVFLQRKTLAEGLIGVATGPKAPGRDASLKLLSIYGGGRVAGRLLSPLRHGTRAAVGAPGRLGGAVRRGGKGEPRRVPLFGTTYSRPVGGGVPAIEASGPTKGSRSGASATGEAGKGNSSPAGKARTASGVSTKGSGLKRPSPDAAASEPETTPRKSSPEGEQAGRSPQREGTSPAGQSARNASTTGKGEDSLGAELRAEREQTHEAMGKPVAGEGRPDPGRDAPSPKRRRRWRRGRGR